MEIVYMMLDRSTGLVRVGCGQPGREKAHAAEGFTEPIAILPACHDDEQALHRLLTPAFKTPRCPKDHSTYEATPEFIDYTKKLILRCYAALSVKDALMLPTLSLDIWGYGNLVNYTDHAGNLDLFVDGVPL